MSVIESLKSRKCVREFLDTPVPQASLEKIFDAVRWCPSSKNTQPWKIAVVSGERKKQLTNRLLNAFEARIKPQMEYGYNSDVLEGDLRERAVQCGKALYGVLDIARDDKKARIDQWKKNYVSFDSPATIFVFKYPDTGDSGYIDCGMLLQSIMLAANELGLATCPQASLTEYPDIVKKELGYSDDFTLLFGIAIGYEDTTAKINNYRTEREPIKSFVKFF